MYKSNRLTTFAQKYGFLLFSSIWIIGYFYLSLTPNAEININGVQQEANFINCLPFLLFGILFSIPYFLYGRKIVYVEMNNESIIIKKNRNTYKYSWSQVERLGLSYLILPPTYKLILQNGNKKTYFFTTGMNGFAVPFYVWDFSEMGTFIKKKKKEYRLEY